MVVIVVIVVIFVIFVVVHTIRGWDARVRVLYLQVDGEGVLTVLKRLQHEAPAVTARGKSGRYTIHELGRVDELRSLNSQNSTRRTGGDRAHGQGVTRGDKARFGGTFPTNLNEERMKSRGIVGGGLRDEGRGSEVGQRDDRGEEVEAKW